MNDTQQSAPARSSWSPLGNISAGGGAGSTATPGGGGGKMSLPGVPAGPATPGPAAPSGPEAKGPQRQRTRYEFVIFFVWREPTLDQAPPAPTQPK
jgi:hypothetical protein